MSDQLKQKKSQEAKQHIADAEKRSDSEQDYPHN